MKKTYLYHIRKTGGTSFNKMMLGYLSGSDPDSYKYLLESKIHTHSFPKGAVTGWNKKQLEIGNYSYGFSHIPFHQLKLNKNDFFKLTIFRDPVARVVSHYKMLMEYKLNNPTHSLLEKEGHFIQDGFEGFVQTLTDEHMFNQLWMFSKKYDVDEAFENIMSLDYFFMTEDFEDSIKEINEKIQVNLKVLHERKSNPIEVDKPIVEKLKERLAPEYELLNKLGLIDE